jgi:hypothetical protein
MRTHPTRQLPRTLARLLAPSLGALLLASGSSSGGPKSSPDGGGSDDDGGTDSGPPVGASVLQHHLNPSRDGHYIDPLMTKAAAAKMTIDTTFDGTITGPLWGHVVVLRGYAGRASEGGEAFLRPKLTRGILVHARRNA